MGGFFSFYKKEEAFSLEDTAASGLLEVDPDVRLGSAPARAAAPASHHPGGAGFAEAAVPTGQNGVGTLARVADPASDSSSDVVVPAELSESR